MQDYALTKHRIFQWMGIILAFGLIAVGYWYYRSQASTLNKNLTADSMSHGLVGYWALDDGTSGATPTSATDSSTNGNTGTLTNGPTWTTGQIGSAVQFDGSNDYITIGDKAELELSSTQSASIGGWFKISAYPSGNREFLITKGGTSGTYEYELDVNGFNSNKLRFCIFNTTGVAAYICVDGTAAPALNTWFHIVGVWDSQAVTGRLYVDGRLDATSSSTTGSITTTKTSNFVIGRRDDNAETSLTGLADEVRVYNRVLTDDEVGQLYRLSSPTGVDTSLKGYWTFDGKDTTSTTAFDRSGVGTTGTLTNSPQTVEAKVAQGLNFFPNGSDNNSYVTMGDPSSGVLDFGSSDFSVGFWMRGRGYTSQGSSANIILGKHNHSSGSNTNGYSFVIGTTHFVSFTIGNGTTAYSATQPVATANDNQWHHIVGVRSGGTSYLYIDGVVLATNTSVTGSVSNNVDFIIGGDAGGQRNMNADIDEVRVYNTAITAAQIQSLYTLGASDKVNSSISQAQGTGRLDSGLAAYYKFDDGSGGNAADASTNTLTGTLTGSPSWTTGQIGGALDLNGSSQYVSVASSTPTDIRNSLTLSVWTNMDTLPGNGQEQTFMYKAVSGGYLFRFYATQSAGTQRIGVTLGGGANNDLSAALTMPTGTWYHFVATYDINTDLLSFYQNGTLISQTPETVVGGYGGGSDGTLYLGSTPTPSNYLDGRLDEARVYNRALSSDEVAQLYRLATPTGTDTGLKGYWPLNGSDIVSTTAYERSGVNANGALTNGPVIVEGKISQAIDFDGSNDYISIADNAAHDIGDTDDLTLTGWFYRDTFTTDDTIVAKRNGIANTDDGYILYIDDSTDKLTFEVSENSGTDEYQLESTQAFTSVGWNHFAIVWDQDSASGSEIYVNGVANTATDTGTIGNLGDLANSIVLAIGAESDVGNPFDGRLDEVRVYKRTLSVAEIKAQYDAGAEDKFNSSISQPQGTGRLDSGLAGYWKLDDGTSGATPTTATDSSNNGNTGTLTSGPTWTTGKIGSAASFDGSDDYITIPDSASLDVGTQASFSVWFKLNAMPGAGTHAQILRKAQSGVEDKQIRVNGTSSKVEFYLHDVALATVLPTVSSVTTDIWYHVVGTYDGVRQRIYLNGVLENSQAGTANVADGTGALSFGRDLVNGPSYLSGLIDEVRFYDRALSTDEVGQLYRLTTPTGVDTSLKGYWSFNGQDMSGTTAYDRSGTGNNGTLTNGPVIAEGKNGQALSFDGSNDYVTVPSSTALNPTSAITVSAWIKRGTISTRQFILSKGASTGSSDHQYWLELTSANLVIFLIASNSAGYSVTSPATLTDTTGWHHIVGTYDGATQRLYIDGVQVVSASVSITLNTTNDNVAIGERSVFNAIPYSGNIDEVRIYSRALSAAEVSALYLNR